MKKVAITIVSVMIVIALAWLAMDRLIGRPISTDLSRVGQGQPALVLAFENYSPAGMGAMDLLNQIRPDYEPDVEFLVADLGTPDGGAFASRFGLPNGVAVLLDGHGRPIQVYPVTDDVSELRRSLDEVLGRSP